MVDKDTLHLKYQHHLDYQEDIRVYKRSESGFATEQPSTTDKDYSQLSPYMTIDDFVGAYNKLSGSTADAAATPAADAAAEATATPAA